MADSAANSDAYHRYLPWILLGAVVAGHVIFNLLLNPIGIPVGGASDLLMLMIIGVLIAQPVLFAIWAVFGPGPFAQRVMWTTAAYVAVIFAAYFTGWNLFNRPGVSNWGDAELLVFPIGVFALAATLMIFFRKLSHWRIVRLRHEGETAVTAKQFTLKFMLGYTALCAGLLTTARIATSSEWLGTPAADTVVALLGGIGGTLLIAFPTLIIPMIVLSKRTTRIVVVMLPVLWVAMTLIAVEMIVATSPTEVRTKVVIDVALVQVGSAAAGLISAFMLRFAHYRLATRCSLNSTQP